MAMTKEEQLRKCLDQQGYGLRKDPARAQSLEHQGGYMILDTRNALPIAGSNFDLTLDDVEEWLNE